MERFRIKYTAQVVNRGVELGGTRLYLPVPTDRAGQDVKNIAFTIKPDSVGTSQPGDNKIACWELGSKPGPGETFTVTERFLLHTWPTRINGPIAGKAKDYPPQAMLPKFLCSNSYVGVGRVEELAEKTCRGLTEVWEIARALYDWVGRNLIWGAPYEGLYTSDQALDRRVTDCGGFNTTFVAMCRALGIPARVVAGWFLTRPRWVNSGYHAWSEFMAPDGTWVPVDPALERLHGVDYFGKLPANRLVFSKGEDFELVPPAPHGIRAALLQTHFQWYEAEPLPKEPPSLIRRGITKLRRMRGRDEHLSQKDPEVKLILEVRRL